MNLRIVASSVNTIWINFWYGSKISGPFTSLEPVVQQLRYRSTEGVRLKFQTFENLAFLNVDQNVLGRVSVKSTDWSKSENCKAKTYGPKDAAEEPSVGCLMNTGLFGLDGDCHYQQWSRIPFCLCSSYFCWN